MRAKWLISLWLALILALGASEARAGLTWLDDAAETSLDSGGSIVPYILPSASRNADVSSGPVNSGGGIRGFIRYRTTTFIGTPVAVLRMEVPDVEGTWQSYCETAAIAAGSTTYTLLVAEGAVTTGSGTPGITGVCARPMPPVFRITFDWTSGTSITLRVDGFAW